MAEFSLQGQRSEVRIRRYRPEFTVSVDGRVYVVRPLPSDAPNRVHLDIGGETIAGICQEDEDRVHLRLGGRTHVLDKHDLLTSGVSQAADGEVRAQLPGNVESIQCAIGDRVSAGDLLLVTTSMKMEVPIQASCDGEVEALLVTTGQAFERGAPLVRMRMQE